jgi:serine/threonine protein phosphatase 1
MSGPAMAARVPDGRRVYAIGDIHGHLVLLEELHGMILADAGGGRAENVIVYLGDYIDRGPDSRGVIEALAAGPLPGFEVVHLMGNHEDFMLRFLEGAEVGRDWFQNGGDATLESYGIRCPGIWSGAKAHARARAELAEALPEAHWGFLRGLSDCHQEGDYFFAHAGIRPGVSLAAQSPHDLMWIRDEFLDSERDHGKIVVHGHTVEREVRFRPNRIGINTGAYDTGCLTCLVLDGAWPYLLQT